MRLGPHCAAQLPVLFRHASLLIPTANLQQFVHLLQHFLYALLLRCVFQSNQGTLREDELTEWSGKVIAALGALGGVMRS